MRCGPRKRWYPSAFVFSFLATPEPQSNCLSNPLAIVAAAMSGPSPADADGPQNVQGDRVGETPNCIPMEIGHME